MPVGHFATPADSFCKRIITAISSARVPVMAAPILVPYVNEGSSSLRVGPARNLTAVYTVSEKDCTLFFIFFSRCPVCGEWCKLH